MLVSYGGTAVQDYSDNTFTISASDYATLHSVKINETNLEVEYSKNFDTCAHLKLASDKTLTHIYNYFCQKGDNIKITMSLNYFNNIEVGTNLILCHGNNANICSNPILVTTTEILSSINYCSQLYNKLIASYNKSCGETGYDAVADIDKDKKVGLGDLSFYAANKTNETWCKEKLDNTTNPCIVSIEENNRMLASISSALKLLMQQALQLLGK
jgi:hypothetical protein